MNIFKLIFASILFIMVATSNYTFAQSKIADADINIQVKDKINYDDRLADTNIQVTTTDGVVTISGKVNTEKQAEIVVQAAQETLGVRDVDTSGLTVGKNTSPLSDAMITAKIKGLFIQEKLFGDRPVSAMTITVKTNNGIVTLNGTADDEIQVSNAVNIAKSVSGVKKVKSHVKISNHT